jgi:hypothetical protein
MTYNYRPVKRLGDSYTNFAVDEGIFLWLQYRLGYGVVPCLNPESVSPDCTAFCSDEVAFVKDLYVR